MSHAIALLTTVAQAGPGVDPAVEPGLGSLVGSAIGAALTTLVIGAILVAVVPDYVERVMAEVAENPVGSFGYGILVVVLFVVVGILLFITIVGILLLIPLALLGGLLWAIGATVGYLAIADRLVGREEGWTKPLLVAAAINGALTVTGIGGIVSLAIGAAGFGAVMRDLLD